MLVNHAMSMADVSCIVLDTCICMDGVSGLWCAPRLARRSAALEGRWWFVSLVQCFLLGLFLGCVGNFRAYALAQLSGAARAPLKPYRR